MANERSAPSSLAGWYVISLRPLGQHANLRRAAERRKARLFAISTLRLASLDARKTLAPALAAPDVIATSPAAVRFAHAQRRLRPRSGQRWYVPGAGTASALRHAGIAQAVLPERGADSEALLQRPELQQLHGRTIGVLTAPGGRDLIAGALQKRGAKVLRADVYQRLPVPPSMRRLAALAALPMRSSLLVSSAEALAVLWSTLDATGRKALARRPAVASSERLCAHLRGLGFKRVLRADSAHPTALLDALAAHVSAGRFR